MARQHAVLGQPPVEAGGDTDEGHVVAEVVEPHAAVPALEAVDIRRHREVVADGVVGDLRADLHDLAAELVAGYGRAARRRAFLPAP